MSDDNTPTNTSNTPAGNGGKASSRRGTLFTIFGVVLLLAAAGWGVYEVMEGGKTVSTDNAYVDASTADVTAQVSAQVLQTNVIETQTVNQGDVLVKLDDTDAQLALATAQSQLDQVTRQVSTYYNNDATLKAQTDAATAQVANAQAALEKAQSAYNDRKTLADIGAIAGEDLVNAKAAVDQAQAALNAAQAQAQAAVGQRNSNAALISNAALSDNPQVRAAQIKVQQAQNDLARMTVVAPISGVVAKKAVDVGGRTQVGSPLMTLVDINNAYVNANFKEVQLKKVKVGQPVLLTADVYGGSVKFHGKVVGLSGGTGSAFAIIPAQNATGNWIKVVQRLPVRIALDPSELKTHPLRIGESMTVKIDVTH